MYATAYTHIGNSSWWTRALPLSFNFYHHTSPEISLTKHQQTLTGAIICRAKQLITNTYTPPSFYFFIFSNIMLFCVGHHRIIYLKIYQRCALELLSQRPDCAFRTSAWKSWINNRLRRTFFKKRGRVVLPPPHTRAEFEFPASSFRTGLLSGKQKSKPEIG